MWTRVFLAAAALAGVLFLGVPGCLGGDPSLDLSPGAMRVLQDAQDALGKGESARARSLLEDFLKGRGQGDRGAALAWYLLGSARYMDGDRKGAYAAYRKGVSLYPDFFPLVSNLAALSYELGRYGEAAGYFVRAYDLSGSPGKPEYLYDGGVSAYQAGEFLRSWDILTRLLDAHPEGLKPGWCVLCAQVLIELHRLDDARAHLLGFIERFPGDPGLWKLLSQVRVLQEDYLQAASALEAAYRLDPPGKEAWEQLSSIYEFLHLPLMAARCLEEARGKALSARECERLARLYLEGHRADKGLYYLERSLDLDPTGEGYLYYGRVLYGLDMVERAKGVLRKALELGVRNKGLAGLLLGLSALETGDLPGARAALAVARKDKAYRNEARAALAVVEGLSR